jgi:aminoglycoside phosphotransferase (APT) family kinase protein
MIDTAANLAAALEQAMARAGRRGAVTGLQRLTGGANMESWRFDCGDGRFVLRRAPSAEWLAGRALDMAGEARVIRLAVAGAVPAPEIVVELRPEDGLGAGYVMVCLAGSADPEMALAAAPVLAEDIAAAMAKIHALDPAQAAYLPRLDVPAGIGRLAAQFDAAGADRPIIALGLAWLRAHVPQAARLCVVHGDLRIGNVMVDQGRLAGVLDWELAHLGDGHEDLAYGCMTVWRFGRLDKPGLGLTDIAHLARAYQAAGGEAFDPARFRFWLVYRTVWWALGCLEMGKAWRSGADRSLERVVVARRTAEQELDLLLLLADDAPFAEVQRAVAPLPPPALPAQGEPAAAEILTAISEWLATTVKPQLQGRDRWELAVAQNALGIVRRELTGQRMAHDRALAQAILAGDAGLATPGLLADLRHRVLATLTCDMPKYPALTPAMAQWASAYGVHT